MSYPSENGRHEAVAWWRETTMWPESQQTAETVWKTRPDNMGALKGVRVVDLSRVLAGPLCTQMMADHGADVIKIEPPFGDETRQLRPPFDEHGIAAYFGAVNRGKDRKSGV